MTPNNRGSDEIDMNEKHLNNNPRLTQILTRIQERGVCSQTEFAEEFDVSVQTVRRDFALLKQNGLIIVKSGVAYINNNGSLVNTDFATRQTKYMPEKKAIAEAIANDIPNGSTIFLTVGTTTEQIAIALLNKKDLTVITSSIRVANLLCDADSTTDVLIPSGKIRKSNGGIIGPSVIKDINQFHVDYMITSIGAITEDGIALEYNVDDVAVSRTIMEQSRKTIIAMDHSKFTSKASVQLCKPEAIDAIYCDEYPSNELLKIFEDNNVSFHKVDV